jgi:hypothetical protein
MYSLRPIFSVVVDMGDGTKERAQRPAYPYIPIIPSEML